MPATTKYCQAKLRCSHSCSGWTVGRLDTAPTRDGAPFVRFMRGMKEVLGEFDQCTPFGYQVDASNRPTWYLSWMPWPTAAEGDQGTAAREVSDTTTLGRANVRAQIPQRSNLIDREGENPSVEAYSGSSQRRIGVTHLRGHPSSPQAVLWTRLATCSAPSGARTVTHPASAPHRSHGNTGGLGSLTSPAGQTRREARQLPVAASDQIITCSASFQSMLMTERRPSSSPRNRCHFRAGSASVALCILDLAGLALRLRNGCSSISARTVSSASMTMCSSPPPPCSSARRGRGPEERATASVVASAVGSEVRWDRRRKPTEIAGSAFASASSKSAALRFRRTPTTDSGGSYELLTASPLTGPSTENLTELPPHILRNTGISVEPLHLSAPRCCRSRLQ